MTEPIVYRVKEVEALLQLSRSTVYELIRSGELPSIRIGRSVRVPREALERWLEGRAA
jgi:excisionase family DNA binding protein